MFAGRHCFGEITRLCPGLLGLDHVGGRCRVGRNKASWAKEVKQQSWHSQMAPSVNPAGRSLVAKERRMPKVDSWKCGRCMDSECRCWRTLQPQGAQAVHSSNHIRQCISGRIHTLHPSSHRRKHPSFPNSSHFLPFCQTILKVLFSGLSNLLNPRTDVIWIRCNRHMIYKNKMWLQIQIQIRPTAYSSLHHNSPG